MRKLILPTIILFIVLAAGIATAVIISNNNNNADSENDAANSTTTTTQSNTTEESDTGSIASLVENRNNTVCTWTDAEYVNSGTVYISDGQLRQDFTSAEGESGSVIFTGNTMYFWSPDTKEGIQYKVDDLENGFNSDSYGQSLDAYANVYSNFDANAEYDLDCTAWTVEPARFEVPANVEFVDMEALMQQLQQFNTST